MMNDLVFVWKGNNLTASARPNSVHAASVRELEFRNSNSACDIKTISADGIQVIEYRVFYIHPGSIINMWAPVLLLSNLWWSVFSQNIANDQGTWGWQMRQTGPGSVGHYFVKLPESEQRVRYIADGSGYHSAVSVATSDPHHQHTTSIALGQRAVELAGQIPTQIYALPNAPNVNQTSFPNQQQEQNPLEIYFLQHQIPSQTQFVQIVPNSQQSFVQYTPVPNYYYSNNVASNPDYYKINNEHKPHEISENNDIRSKDIVIDNTKSDANDEIIETKENGPVVVFKDHKCNNDETQTSTKVNYINEVQKSSSAIVDPPSYQHNNIHGNFGAREYKKQIHETSNTNTSPAKEEYQHSAETNYYSTESPQTLTQNEGISRLVASTQDLISNDDLLKINHAAERAVNHYNEDFIKPRQQPYLRAIHFKSKNANVNRPRSRITVSAKVGKIVDSNVEHSQTDKEPTYPTRNNEYKFSSPIVVDDSNYSGYKQQILNNFVSTMVPYIEGGYEIVDVRNSINENNTYSDQNKSGQFINIAPRPVSQNYLAPITVALRLLNDNNTVNFNTVEDPEPSDSEFIENAVKGPRKEKTVVEIQESIPVEITHINDVEYHEYLDEGRSNNQSPLGVGKSLYQKYVQSLDSENNVLNGYNSKQNFKNSDNSHNPDQKQTLDPDENILSQDQTQSNSDSENSYYYNTENRNKIIQPIIIEKQIPVTTYVDRFIEKQVPYPERVEVLKQVPVDRPVPVPVHYETIVEKPVEVTRYIDKPYPVEVLKPYPVEVRVPYPVEHKVYVDRPIHVPYPIEKVIEKQLIHPIPVPTPVGIPIGIPIEKRVLYPVPYETPVPVAVPIEKPVTVEKIVEKKVPVPYPVEKQVPYPVRHEVQVPVPYAVEKRIPVPVEVPRPYPVDRIVEKKVPYPVHVDRIVERKVPVQVPYPVKTFVEKIVEKPVVVTKYVNKPYAVEKRVPYPVDRIVERKVPYPVHIPYSVDKNVQKSEPPYPFESNEKITTLYSYGVSQEALQNVANYLKHNQEQYQQPIPNYTQAIDDYNTQQFQQAESKRNYEIQLANANVLRNIQNVTPMFRSKWGNQYASSFHYLNATDTPTNNNYIKQDNFKYYGPPPLNNYDGNWEKNKDYTEPSRRTDRKISNVRIEYGGFKPPLIPSTEIDLDGVPIKKHN